MGNIAESRGMGRWLLEIKMLFKEVLVIKLNTAQGKSLSCSFIIYLFLFIHNWAKFASLATKHLNSLEAKSKKKEKKPLKWAYREHVLWNGHILWRQWQEWPLSTRMMENNMKRGFIFYKKTFFKKVKRTLRTIICNY